MNTPSRTPFTPRILALSSGALVRVRMVRVQDIVFDYVELITPAEGAVPAVYRDLAVAQSVSPVPDYDFATAEEWPTDAELAAAIANPPAPVLTVEQIWANWLSGSIVDPVLSIALKANRQARNDFIGQATLLREAVDAGYVTGETEVEIWDASNTKHVLTVTACRALLLRYGFAWNAAFNELAP